LNKYKQPSPAESGQEDDMRPISKSAERKAKAIATKLKAEYIGYYWQGTSLVVQFRRNGVTVENWNPNGWSQ